MLRYDIYNKLINFLILLTIVFKNFQIKLLLLLEEKY